jgi:hypothetical protein
MNSQEMGIASPRRAGLFRHHDSGCCPDCEVRFPLQILVAELLRKNQTLRAELQEARGRLSALDQGLITL